MNFGQQLAHLVNEAIRAGTSPQEIILNLEMCSHELKNSVLACAATQTGNTITEAPPIIIPNGNG